MDIKKQEDVERFWKEKEQEIGEKVKGKDMSEYISGRQELKEKSWGLLYYTESAFYFQTFTRRNWLTSLIGGGKTEQTGDTIIFRILWEKVREIVLPAKKNNFFAFLSPPDHRVFIQYQSNGQEDTLVFVMYSRDSRDRFLDCYHQSKKRSSL